MKNRLWLPGTLLRKDLRLFGPFAALIAALLALSQFPNLMLQLGSIAGLMQTGLQLGTALLILVVCYEDAVVSLKHDWLTRPIPGPTLLLAKSLFVFLATILPGILGALVYNLTQGRPFGEALLAGIASGARGDILTVFTTIMAFAAVTANIRQAVTVFLAGMAVVALITVSWSALHEVPESPAFSGSGWVVKRGVQLLLMLAAISILWMQYRHRHTKASRGIAAVAFVAGTWIVVLMTWSPVFAIQKALSPDPQAAAPVQVALAEGCFPARVLDAAPDAAGSVTTGLTAQRYSEEHRRFAGPGAVAFSTRVVGRQVPEGDLLIVDHAVVRYFIAGQEFQHLRSGRTSTQWMKAVGGIPVADHYWLLSAADTKQLASTPTVETRLDYSLSLLAPKNHAQFAADGRRRYYRGIGYCGADFDRSSGSVAVSCFKPGTQPALLVANIDGTAEFATTPNRGADFTPALLDFWGGYRHNMQLVARGAEAPRVTVTAYEARAHFDRELVLPGILGGPMSSCPVPTNP